MRNKALPQGSALPLIPIDKFAKNELNVPNFDPTIFDRMTHDTYIWTIQTTSNGKIASFRPVALCICQCFTMLKNLRLSTNLKKRKKMTPIVIFQF